MSTIHRHLPISALLNKDSPLDGEIHAYIFNRLGGALLRNMLQLVDVRGRTATHSDPFDGRRSSVWLKVCCSRH
jgi:hypothetical protein